MRSSTPSRWASSSWPPRGTSPTPSRPVGCWRPWPPGTRSCSSRAPRPRRPRRSSSTSSWRRASIDDQVQLVPAPDDDAAAPADHPPGGRRGRPHRLLRDRRGSSVAGYPLGACSAETSGKNAMVVAATADVDQAVSDLVRSAFGHAGQKCSAASLAIVDGSVHDRSPFLRQLRRRHPQPPGGTGHRPGHRGRPDRGAVHARRWSGPSRSSTRGSPGWSSRPCVDAQARLWSPGVRIGVRPGSWAHMTEWFGPVLGVMRAADLEEATRMAERRRRSGSRPASSRSTRRSTALGRRVEAGQPVREPHHDRRHRGPPTLRGLEAIERRPDGQGGRPQLPARPSALA